MTENIAENPNWSEWSIRGNDWGFLLVFSTKALFVLIGSIVV